MRWPFNKKGTSDKEAARLHYNAKDYKKAEPFLEQMLKRNPNDSWALDVLSRLYMNTSRHSQAIILLNRLISFRPEPKALRRIVYAACVENDIGSLFRFADSIEWVAGDEDLLSKIHQTFWHHPSCKTFFHDTKWNADLAFPTYVRAGHLFDSGDIEPAIDLLTTLVSNKVVNESTLMFAREICESLGQIEMAHDLWANYLGHIEGELSRKRSLAKRLRHARRFDEALEIAMMVLDEAPNDVQMLSLITEIGYHTETPRTTLDAYHRLNSLNEAKLYHLRRFADAAIKASSVTDMVQASEKLIYLDADANATIRKSYIKICELGAFAEAKKLLRLIEGSPLEIDLRAARALEEGDPEAALSLLDDGLNRHPKHISFLMRKGIALEALGQLNDAITLFDSVLELKPEHQSASQRRLKCGLKVWPEKDYYNEITDATRTFPENINLQFDRLNYVLSVKKDLDMALEIIQSCLESHPDHQRSHLYHGLIHSWMGLHTEARSTIGKCLIRWPKSNEVYITASQIEKNAGEPKKQIEHINSMLATHGLMPIASSCPSLAITPEFLSTLTDSPVNDDRLVSIVMTTYKRDPLLDAAIASILNQTYRNIELLIVDDCSPDDNFSYLKELAEKDERIRVFQMEENGGTYLAKNYGMTQANGDFIGFMDSDDYCHAQRIEFQISSLDLHPEVMGVTHDYFRIDESSDVEFRGIGALRMACISLLIRREVIDAIGFFDSLRVGADTEFIERIEAYYGGERRLRLRVPSMFMMLHSSSLTGGGPFHISWRSVTGHRLQHHRSFRAWHKKIKARTESPFVPRKIRTRPFEAPDEMKSTHYQWKEGMPLFSEMIKKRNHDWWKGKKSVWQKTLSPKIAGRDYVEAMELKVPALYWTGKNLEDVPSFEELPENFVLKPEKGWSSNNVYCMKGGTDILTHAEYSRANIVEALKNDEFVSKNKPVIMLEELLEPEDKQSDDILPRDFKFYCFGEEIAMVHVALRKSEVHKEKNLHQYYTANFEIIKDKIMEKRQQGHIPIEKPDCWEEMIESVGKIGKSLGMYMRIDMFATNRGAVFGEFTPTPHGGNGYSKYADQFLGSFWKGEEGFE